MNFTEYFYSLVKQIPKGKVSTYGALARALGDIRASRAVGRMLNQNPYAPIVPCHRVVMSDGSLGGFGTGIEKKIKLLKKEGVKVSGNDILDFEKALFTDFMSDFPLKKMRNEQKRLRKSVRLEDGFDDIETVGGVDVAYSHKGFGGLVVYDYKSFDINKRVSVKDEIDMPYIPTYLAFRELPLIEKLLKKYKQGPSVLLIDGNGVLHPYGMGIASHVGVKLDIPTIGVAKKLLCGEQKDDKILPGEYSEVEYEGNLVGYAYRSSPRTKKPIYISPGHMVSFETSLEVIKNFCKYKLPEPIRSAHKLATEARNSA
ncbi:MAG: endonuclease V [Thermoplasmata archaeon]|nr:MAG: endonuclease V [Thermoplasmata archaeon]